MSVSPLGQRSRYGEKNRRPVGSFDLGFGHDLALPWHGDEFCVREAVLKPRDLFVEVRAGLQLIDGILAICLARPLLERGEFLQ